MKFQEIASSGSRVVPFGHTDGQKDRDMTNSLVAFRKFSNGFKFQ